MQAIQTRITKKLHYIIYGVIISIFSLLLFNYNATSAITSSVDYNISVGSSLNLEISSSTVSMTLNPASKTFDTKDLGITVGTNYINGYNLYINSTSTDLTNNEYTGTSYAIGTLADTTTTGNFPAGYWGYRISSGDTGDDGITDTSTQSDSTNYYKFVPNTLVSSSSTAINNNATTLTFATKIDYTKPAGTYTNTFTFNAIVNPVTYSITYADNTGDAIGSMPSPNPQTGMIASGSATLSSTVPTRDGYTFKSWCQGTVSNSGTTCTGTEYSAGGSFPISSTVGPEVSATLTAVWEEDRILLYDEVASMTKGTLASNSVALSDAITTANSGVYTYDATTYGAASDASNDYPIYFYRGILDDATGSFGSDGDARAYPNYVKLGTTCWRIVRTTGSGGVKMIYNGTWTGSTCANATTSAQLSSTSAYDTSANSSAKSIVGVGYTYNASYKTTTSSTQAGILFGTDSSYSGNTTDSTIKGVIDTWYSSNLASAYGSYLEASAGYCNDRSVNSGTDWTTYDDSTSITTPYSTATSGNEKFYFGAQMRNIAANQTVTLGCPRPVVDLYTTSSASNGNKQLSYPISLITADEATFAGSGNFNESGSSQNSKNSFIVSGNLFWLLSPRLRRTSGSSAMAGINSTPGILGAYDINRTEGVRPAISLKHGTKITSGSGTATDPWEVSW